MKIIDNMLHDHITKDKAYTLPLESTDIDFSTYHSIQADFKAVEKLDAPAVFRLSIGSGITVEGNTLLLSLSAGQTAKIRQRNLYMDIKAIPSEGAAPLILATARYTVNESITNIAVAP